MAHCLRLGFVRGTTIVDPSTKSVIAWIKYGPNVTIDEARTQDWTAKALRDVGASDLQVPRVFHAFTAEYYGCSIGYIAMEFIEVAMKKPWDDFSQTVVRKIAYPHQRSDGAAALLSASGSLVQYGPKPVALPSGVSRRMNGS